MVNENEVLLKDHLKEILTAENFGRMLERIDNVDEIMEKGMKKGMKKGIAKGREEARALTIGTFLLKMPDMPDEEVASLFDVTVEYVKDLREQMCSLDSFMAWLFIANIGGLFMFSSKWLIISM